MSASEYVLHCRRCDFRWHFTYYRPITVALVLYGHYWTRHPRQAAKGVNQAP